VKIQQLIVEQKKNTVETRKGTVIKDNVYITCGSRIGHDCVIGNDVTIISSSLAGHVKIDDMAVIGGRSSIKQHIHIGKLTMVGAQSLLVKDTLPYYLAQGSPAYLSGVNLVGLRRNIAIIILMNRLNFYWRSKDIYFQIKI